MSDWLEDLREWVDGGCRPTREDGKKLIAEIYRLRAVVQTLQVVAGDAAYDAVQSIYNDAVRAHQVADAVGDAARKLAGGA